MGFTDSFKKVIGLADIDEDEIVTEDELKRERPRPEKPVFPVGESSEARAQSYGNAVRRGGGGSAPKGIGKKFSFTGTNPLKLILIEPKGFDECPKLVDSLKSNKPVILNLEKLETDVARKIFDFISGATYALDGNVQKIANNIFIFTPNNVSVAAQKSSGFSSDADEQMRWR